MCEYPRTQIVTKAKRFARNGWESKKLLKKIGQKLTESELDWSFNTYHLKKVKLLQINDIVIDRFNERLSK